ncbi:MAG: T9SS type A sorting domain-containing protein [Saprospiraceae bacterium]|nr:T9SS type A sorting domain-containing protein [Saprospiraceae bacterium]
MNGCLYAGVFAESINAGVTTTATLDNVSIYRALNLTADLPQFVTQNDGLNVSVYPNPGNGEMTLSVMGAPERNLHLEVTDMMGRMVRNIELPEGSIFTHSINLSNEPAGVYYLRLRSETGVISVQRVLVQQ